MHDYLIREEMMFGPEAVQRLQAKHVAVFGIGGVGSYAVEALARAGIGALTLVDNDTVGVSNLNRQLCALRSTVRSLPLLYNEENKAAFFDRQYDYIIDAIDLVSCKLSLIQNAMAQNIPIISAMGTGNKLDPTQFRIADISETSGCHLARIMRRELRARGILHHTVLYSQELPRKPLELEPPPPGRRTVPASVSWVPSCAGLMLAGRVIQDLMNAE